MKKELEEQYISALKMLDNVITLCPEKLWDDAVNYENTYWRIVYHTLFYTALYLAENVDSFTRWENHLPNYNRLGKVNDDDEPIVITTSYSKVELGDYLQSIYAGLTNNFDEHNFSNPSNFEWLPMTKLELHLYNLRHLQHHIGQLVERLHGNGITGVEWY
jgi:hypothetical protein